MPTPSIKSISSIKALKSRILGGRSSGPKTSKSNFFKTSSSTIPAPPPTPAGPSTREVKPAEAKAEAKGAEVAKTAESIEANTNEATQTDKITKTVKNATPPKDLDQTNPSTAQKDKATNRVVNEVGVKGAFAKTWQHEKTEYLREIKSSQYSYYTPNCISMFQTLEAMDLAFDGNSHLRWIHKNYLALPTRLYYSILYFIRIIAVRETFGVNSAGLSTWYRRLTRNYPLEELPIAGPLVPFFTALCAHEPNDSRMSWLIPSVPEDLGTIFRTGTDVNYLYTQPDVASLFDMMHRICDPTYPFVAATNRENERFVFNVSTAAFTMGGHAYTAALAGATDRARLRNPALAFPFVDSFLRFQETRPYWTSTKLATNTVPISTATTAFGTLQQWMRLDGSMAWFSDCVNAENIRNQYFSDGSNLSQMDFSGGDEVHPFARVSVNANNTTRDFTTHTWYPRVFDDMTAEVNVYAEKIAIPCFYNFKNTLHNASFHLHGAMTTTGTDDDTTMFVTNPHTYRNGPFYATTQAGAPLPVFTTKWERTANDMPVCDRRLKFVTDNFYISNGLGGQELNAL